MFSFFFFFFFFSVSFWTETPSCVMRISITKCVEKLLKMCLVVLF